MNSKLDIVIIMINVRLHFGLCLWLDSMKSIYRSNINMIVLMTAGPGAPTDSPPVLTLGSLWSWLSLIKAAFPSLYFADRVIGGKRVHGLPGGCQPWEAWAGRMEESSKVCKQRISPSDMHGQVLYNLFKNQTINACLDCLGMKIYNQSLC